MNEDDQRSEEYRLMTAVANGDEEAFAEVIERLQKSVYHYFWRMGCAPELAEDFSQETFLRLYQHAERFRPQVKLTTYTLTIAHNILVDYWRRQKITTAPLNGEECAAPGNSPLRRLLHDELQARIREALLNLPENQREPVILAVIDDLPYATVAQILDLPLGTLKSRIYYGLKSLRETLSEQGFSRNHEEEK